MLLVSGPPTKATCCRTQFVSAIFTSIGQFHLIKCSCLTHHKPSPFNGTLSKCSILSTWFGEIKLFLKSMAAKSIKLLSKIRSGNYSSGVMEIGGDNWDQLKFSVNYWVMYLFLNYWKSGLKSALLLYVIRWSHRMSLTLKIFQTFSFAQFTSRMILLTSLYRDLACNAGGFGFHLIIFCLLLKLP